MKNNNKFMFIRIITVFLLSLAVLLPGIASAAGNAVVSVSAPAGAVEPGAQFTISINVQPNNSVAGAQFNLSFNPSVITANSVAEGNLLNQGGASTYFNAGNIDNVAGTISGVFGAIISPGQTVSTAGTFAVITMTAGAGGGSCPLTLSNVVIGDAMGQSVPADVNNATVNVNRPPVLASIGNKSVNEGQTLTFIVSATDPDGGTLTYSASNLPSGASFTPATRTFTWTPGYTQAGSYPNVHFQVSDGSLTDSEDITITVVNVNQPPVLATIGSRSVNEGQTLTFTVSATDSDGGALTYSASSLPSGANFTPATRTFAWTPGYNQSGTYGSVHFSVSDSSLNDTEDITITVNNVVRPDINTDGLVNVLDMISVAQHWDESGTSGWIPEDVNENGTVNVLDVILIGQYWTV